MANIKHLLDKIRTAIYGKEVRGSLADGLQAVNNESEDAKEISVNVEQRQDAVEEQFDDVLSELSDDREVDNAETIAARTNRETGNNYKTLGNRLDDENKKVTQQLADIAQQEIYADIDQTPYKAGSKFDPAYLQSRQAEMYARFIQKLRLKEELTISCIGTSITEGYDHNSADKRSKTGGGTSYIAGKTYPEQLSEILNEIYDDTVTVENKGWSGDTVFAGYDRWNKKHDSDLSILEYGSNDSTLDRNIQTFLSRYEQFIIREILWDNAVMILLPSKTKESESINRDVFRNSVYALANKYSVPVIDTKIFLKNYDYSIYSDDVHLTTYGYSVLGTKVAALFLGEGPNKPKNIVAGSKLLSRPSIDNITYGKNADKSRTSSTGQTPNETDSSGRGIIANLNGRNNNEASVYYSFYADTDDLVIIPHAYLFEGAELEITLDWGLKEPQNSINDALFLEPSIDDEKGVFNVSAESDSVVIGKKNYEHIFERKIHVKTEGWHLLKITSKKEMTSLYGIEFVNYPTSRESVFAFQVGEDNVIETDETRIPYNLFTDHINYSFDDRFYWRNPALKITLNTPLHSVDSYVFTLGNKRHADTPGFAVVGDRQRFLVDDSVDTSEIRTLTGIDYDRDTDEVVFKWGGDKARRCTCTITLA